LEEKIEMNREEELAKYLSLIEYYKDQLNSIEIQSSYLQAAIAEYYKTRMTVEQLNKISDGNEILIPVGGSTFINACIKNPSKVLFDIGAGIVTEKTVDDAIKKINQRIENLQETQKKLLSIAQQLQNEAAEISKKMQKLISEEKE